MANTPQQAPDRAALEAQNRKLTDGPVNLRTERLASAATERQIAQRIPGETSSKPALALLLGWLVPGGGHFLLGKYIRGTLLLLSILTLFFLGLALHGKLDSLGTDDFLDKLGFAGQLGAGLVFLLGKALGWGPGPVLIVVQDYGTKFLIFAGLLNIIAAVDAHALASGRKHDLPDDVTTVRHAHPSKVEVPESRTRVTTTAEGSAA